MIKLTIYNNRLLLWSKYAQDHAHVPGTCGWQITAELDWEGQFNAAVNPIGARQIRYRRGVETDTCTCAASYALSGWQGKRWKGRSKENSCSKGIWICKIYL